MGKNWKRLFSYSLMVVMMLGLCGLALAAENAGATVTAITWDTATARAIQKLIPEFEKETGIKIDWNVFSEPVLREKVVADLAAKTGTYDIFLLDGWQTARYARAGYVAPLDDLLANKKSKYYCEDFAPIFLDALRYEGKLWGLPYYGHVGILMYRKDQFTEKGIDVPKTTDDLMNAAAKLT
ncbi:MAG: extracellular solute-binding protein, partial [Atribacterota bacterium]